VEGIRANRAKGQGRQGIVIYKADEVRVVQEAQQVWTFPASRKGIPYRRILSPFCPSLPSLLLLLRYSRLSVSVAAFDIRCSPFPTTPGNFVLFAGDNNDDLS
jgi:hypothetical protein